VLDGDAEIERAIEAGDTSYARAPRECNTPLAHSVAITRDDGLVYLMRASSPASVYAISAAGEVVRKIVMMPPTEAGVPAFGVRITKNKLIIRFSHGCESPSRSGSCEGTVYAVVDATTGERLAKYAAEGNLTGPIACYVPEPDRIFTFWIPPGQHHLEIIESVPR
jgi:hypothetical protein